MTKPKLSFKVIRVHRFCLQRQVHEGIRISTEFKGRMEKESVETDIGAFVIERELREVERDMSVGEKVLRIEITNLTNKLINTLPVSKLLHSLALFKELPMI